MLIYFNLGIRHYYEEPIPVVVRHRWSFQVVLNGEIAPVTAEGPGFLKKHHLWLCRPDFAHGWTGVPNQAADVVVVHFASLPTELERLLPDQHFLSQALNPRQCEEIRCLSKTVAKFWRAPLPGRSLYFEKLRFDLSILLHESIRGNLEEVPFSVLSQKRAMMAMHWFEEHLADNPSLKQVCQAVGVSTSQLRRDFAETFHLSPKRTFDDLRLKRALEILQNGNDQVERIAEQCGYLSASALSRAFKAKFGRSPSHFLPQKKRGLCGNMIARPESRGKH